MKRILWMTATISLLSSAPLCLAQKPGEPAAANTQGAGVAPTAEAPTPGGRAKRPSISSSGSLAVGHYFTTGSRGDSIPPVMIRFSQTDAKTSAALEEDIFVMARVISRTLERADRENSAAAGRPDYRMGVPMLLSGSGRSVRPLYIEGLGPLFMIKVNFALLPPAKGSEKKRAESADSEWDAAHEDVFGPEQIAEEYSPRTSSYNEEQVEALKKELIGALKNATNIRGLKPDEFVNIVVFGHASRGKSGAYAKSANSFAYDTNAAESGVDKGSVLTLRARKADIDAFAGGKLDMDAFRAKVNMTAYPGSGSGIMSLNSWIQESAGRLQLR